MPDVLDAEVDALLEVAVADDFVHDHTNGAGRHVVDDSSAATITHSSFSMPTTLMKGGERTRGSICGACPFAGPRWP